MSDPKFTICWIDDEFSRDSPNRARMTTAAEIAKTFEGEVILNTLSPDELTGWLTSEPVCEPDLLIIDNDLHSAGVSDNAPTFFDKGRKVAAFLEEEAATRDTPKYFISSPFTDKHLGPYEKPFDWIITYDVLANKFGSVLLDLKGYRDIGQALASQDQLNELVSLAFPPESSADQLKELLTQHMNPSAQRRTDRPIPSVEHISGSTRRSIGRWFRGQLLVRNGLLIDDNLAATILGCTFEHFDEVIRHRLKGKNPAAEYQGIFASSSPRRWWKTSIYDWLTDEFPDFILSSSSKISRQATTRLDVPDGEIAVCQVCSERYPETVAFDKNNPEESTTHAVHIGCSSPVFGESISLGFEAEREFSDD